MDVYATSPQIISAIKNIYLRQLLEIVGEPHRMRPDFNRAQFRALATYNAVNFPATALEVRPPAGVGAWADYTRLDYQNIIAAASSKEKVRIAILDCELRIVRDQLSLLLQAIFNMDFVVNNGKLIYKVPTAQELLHILVVPLIYKQAGVEVVVHVEDGAVPTNEQVANAMRHQMLAHGILDHMSEDDMNMYISLLGLTENELSALQRYDERIIQIRDALAE